MNDRFAPTPKPPYYAVIFSNQLSENPNGYDQMADKMLEMAQGRSGFLGAESTRDETGFGITVSYWRDETSIADWKADGAHMAAQRFGISDWYDHYHLRVAKVERAYSGPEGRTA
ncbi:antibiotic biosynthesis monooxygenase [Aliiroseovarius sp. KMU-50]|uniref:Antibiotic biosynthesis monooxygenase n=1 Tax=Aliiroseovarius salicola TaxID=3009082 RepID=A0ABT4W2Z3_9RHOB|nr:antibiotic biosynthesis monooxygenase [Aliiroseovarius sp. KMU-50]MDA5094889.1 antibiotic biosynthesis monooxygenase [Aliiroseovarius sp. KMU-50]